MHTPKNGAAAAFAGPRSRSSKKRLERVSITRGSESRIVLSGEQSQGLVKVRKSTSAMTWKICSMLALLRLSDARSVATEALRTADFIKAVQVVMCSRQRLDNVLNAPQMQFLRSWLRSSTPLWAAI
jgi:hypothetical protein